MRRLSLAILAALATLGGPAAASAMDGPMHGGGMSAGASAEGVSILFGGFSPARIDVVAGDAVRWSNNSLRAHTVTADDGAFGSARLFGSQTFSQRFDTPGTTTYYCTLHTFMRGEVDVHRVLLAAPHEPGAPGREYSLRGRAALPTGENVAIEADSGAGFRQVGNATVGSDGSFVADVKPTTTADYRAVADGEASPAVQLLVLDRKLTASETSRGGRVVVNSRVAPASPGAPVVLQLRLPQHFGWWPVARGRLDHHSRARFALRLGHRYPARVVLTLSDGATALATSRLLHVGPR
jgi:plastocyanin